MKRTERYMVKLAYPNLDIDAANIMYIDKKVLEIVSEYPLRHTVVLEWFASSAD